jgi:hypothetical protein
MDENHPVCDECGTPLITYTDRKDNEEQYCPKCEPPKPLLRPHPDQSGERAFKEGLSKLVHEGAPKEPCPECGALNWYPVGCWWSCGGKGGHPCGHLLGVNKPLGQPKDAGPSPCDFDPCVGQKCRISCDKCMTIIKEVRELDEKGWNGVLKPAPAQQAAPPAPAQAQPRYCTECDGGGEPLTADGTCVECGAEYGTIGDDLSAEQRDRLAAVIQQPAPAQAQPVMVHIPCSFCGANYPQPHLEHCPEQRPAQAQPPGKPGSLDAAFTRGVEFIVEKSPPAPVRPERCPNDPLGAKCFPDDCHCWDPVDGCTALPAPTKPVVELPDLVLEIWAKDGKADEWRMSDPSNPGRALGGLDIEWIKAAISPRPGAETAPIQLHCIQFDPSLQTHCKENPSWGAPEDGVPHWDCDGLDDSCDGYELPPTQGDYDRMHEEDVAEEAARERAEIERHLPREDW